MLKLALRHSNHYDHPSAFYSTHFGQNEFVEPDVGVLATHFTCSRSDDAPLSSRFQQGKSSRKIFTNHWRGSYDGNVELAHKIIELYEANKERDWPAIFESRATLLPTNSAAIPKTSVVSLSDA